MQSKGNDAESLRKCHWAASGRVQAIVNPTGVLAATRLLSTTIQQELDHERYTET